MNKIYDEDFFNKDQKERFLKDHDKAYSRVLKRASIMENKLNKDLYDFTLQEIAQFFLFMKSTRLSSLQHTGSIIHSYIGWAIDQDLRKDNINPLSAVTSFEWYKQFIDNSEQTLFTDKDIDNVVAGCINFQDKAVIQAIYEGIMGRGYSELLNMKMEHITPIEGSDNYNIELFNHASTGIQTRQIVISKHLFNILRIANTEEIYRKNNGILKEGIKKKSNDLVENDYILRTAINSRTVNDKNAPAPSPLINRRVAKVSDWNNLPLLTPINIRNSGMLKMARDLYKEHDKLEKEEYYKICEHFNVGRNKDGSYNYHLFRTDFLSLENLERLYDLEE